MSDAAWRPHPGVIRGLFDITLVLVSLTLGVLAKSWATDVLGGGDPNAINWNTLAQLVFTFLGVVFTGVMAIYVAKTNKAAQDTKVAQVEAAGTLKEVHTAVNSGRTALEAEVAKLQAVVLGLTTDKATLAAEAHVAEVAKAVADSKLITEAEKKVPPA